MTDIAKLKAAAERAKAAVADYQSGVIDAAEFHRRAAEFHRLTDSPEQTLELIAALEAAEKQNAALREKTKQLSIEESQFLTDVITAAGLLSYGKQDKGLARRITDFCVSKRGNSNSAQLRKGGAA